MSRLEDYAEGDSRELRLAAQLVFEEMLERIAIIRTDGDEPEPEVETGGEQHPLAFDVGLVITQDIFRHIQQRLVKDAHLRHERDFFRNRHVTNGLDGDDQITGLHQVVFALAIVKVDLVPTLKVLITKADFTIDVLAGAEIKPEMRRPHVGQVVDRKAHV